MGYNSHAIYCAEFNVCLFVFLLSIHRYVYPSPWSRLEYFYHLPKETVYHLVAPSYPGPGNHYLTFCLCRLLYSGQYT